MSNPIIILPTHSDYKDVVCNFLQLLKKNWHECPYDIVVSVTGDIIDIDNIKVEYNGKNASLIDCVVNVAKRNKSDYYLVFLGDAFISKEINNNVVSELITTLINNQINYCSFNYVRNYKRKKVYNSFFRYINELDRYSHSFVAFFASRLYIEKTLSKFKTDYDFETHYLNQHRNHYYRKHLIVTKNYFNILPGIIKGKWNRINLKKLKKNNPDIFFTERPIQTCKESTICYIRSIVVSFLPKGMRVTVKRLTERCLKYEFGVKE